MNQEQATLSTAGRRPTFCTLFNIFNEHLNKDIGLIPYAMHKCGGYDSFIATYINGEYPNLKYTPGLRLEEVPRVKGDYNKTFSWDIFHWLRKNAKRIDVLNLYHMNRRTIIRALIYKLFNPKGKIYVKCDGLRLPKRRIIMRHAGYTLTRMCDLVSTEFEENAALMSEKWHSKIGCVPNPANPYELEDFRPFSKRSSTILYVGRVERAKGSHTLLEAFANICKKIPEWSLKLVGNITDEDIVSDFCAAHPELKDRVIFTGEIRDRTQLIEMYRDAKVFAFPSRYESFGIALTEAIMQGCFAVTSDIPASRMNTENFRFAFGSKVDDVDGLAANLLYACTHEAQTEALAREGMEATRRRCDLKHCCDVIAEGLR